MQCFGIKMVKQFFTVPSLEDTSVSLLISDIKGDRLFFLSTAC